MGRRQRIPFVQIGDFFTITSFLHRQTEFDRHGRTYRQVHEALQQEIILVVSSIDLKKPTLRVGFFVFHVNLRHDNPAAVC